MIAPPLPPGKLELAYLFVAKFADGTVYEQTPEDVSRTEPGRSAFFDIAGREDLELFHLERDAHRYLVDLRDGHFEIQHFDAMYCDLVGAHFWIEIPPPGAKLSLVYFRRRRHHRTSTVIIDELLQPVVTGFEECQECEYHFGWEAANGQRAVMILV